MGVSFSKLLVQFHRGIQYEAILKGNDGGKETNGHYSSFGVNYWVLKL